ncbi:hypothetical protein Pcinc_007039 [Petrolisthes cinctipes]|uniref:Protein phosphatase 1 regulatory subunit 35 C-terminal domain-containing protein n=1 Tax=Petrolisthes cinctipes TaxID=88211 RepID=A0AAE1KYJ9_PETCI|nr:hypothetical protein Pcinc_007039 [Petrolisthes cinctipes]
MRETLVLNRRPPTVASKPIILVNTENQGITGVPNVNPAAKKCINQRKQDTPPSLHVNKGKGKVERNKTKQECPLPESGVEVCGVPEIHSTLRVCEALVRARQEEPDLSLLVEDKLESPNTASRFKKQVSKQVNVPDSQTVFQELVSLDVSEGTLAGQLKDLMTVRAAAVMPINQPPDPTPCPSDVVNPEEYVTTSCVTTASVNLSFTSISPFSLNTKHFDTHRQYILGSKYDS